MVPLHLHVDVLVVGAGFAGSLTALLAHRIGRSVAIVERGSHPRFALGESATPLADLILAELAVRYQLPRLAPLAEYGTWQQAYPDLVCGLKRGFSYFHQPRGERWLPRDDRANELLIVASKGAADADTHWLRSQFDHFLADEVRSAGIELLENAPIRELIGGPPWRAAGTADGRPFTIDAHFLVDASGGGRVLANHFKMVDRQSRMHTCSRSIYGHFRGVRPWCDVMSEAGGRTDLHTFPSDDAALHQVFDGGWMYILRFQNGVTSAGWMLDAERFPLDTSLPVADEWSLWLSRYPSLAEQFRDAQLIDPPGGLCRTPRLQHRFDPSAAEGWAMLPASAYTLDALHSTGNAHSLTSIERLIDILERDWQTPGMPVRLADYSRTMQTEINYIDRLVHGGYRAMGQFELFATFAMFYFIAAHNSETRRRNGFRREPFLWAGQPDFQAVFDDAYRQLLSITEHGPAAASDLRAFAQHVAAGLEPFNIAGLEFPDGQGFAGGLRM